MVVFSKPIGKFTLVKIETDSHPDTYLLEESGDGDRRYHIVILDKEKP